MKLPNYISSDEKCRRFGTNSYCRIETSQAFDQWYARMASNTALIYRGVKEACYKNYTSAQRKVIIEELPDQRKLILSELDILRKSHGELLREYCNSLGMICSDMYLLSFAQHYGGVSPLLDFSLNLDKALYFMLDEAGMKSEGADRGSLNNYMSLYSAPYDKGLEKQMIGIAGKAFDNEFKEGTLSKEASVILSKTMFTLQVLAQIAVTSYIKGEDRRIKESGADRQTQIYAELSRDEYVVSYIESMFQYPTLGKYELPEIQPLLITNSPVYVELGYETKRTGVIISNLNIVAQEGCFVYYDRDLNPLEYQLQCADIHKSLIPYIRQKYLSDLTRDKIYPDPTDIARKSLFSAQADL